MPSLDAIDVRVISDRQELEEYEDQCNQDDDSHRATRYIEIKSGQDFRVQLKLGPDFDFRGANCVRWELYIDNESGSVKMTLKQGDFDRAVRAGRDAVSIDRPATIYNNMAGTWEVYQRSFGELTILEEDDEEAMDMHSASTPTDFLENLGLIRVRAFRAIQTKIDGISLYNRTLTDAPIVLNQLSKKTLVENRNADDKFINNNIKYGARKPFKYRPPPFHYHYDPLPGEAGDPYRFVFKYRDSKLLTSLGVKPVVIDATNIEPTGQLPQDPEQESKDVDGKEAEETDTKEELLRQKDREIEMLKAQLASVKSETGKRTLAPDGAAATSSGAKRARRAGLNRTMELVAKVVIDLTGD